MVNTVTSSSNAPDLIAKGPDALPQELSSNVSSAKVTTLYVIVHHCLQLTKRLRAQDKFESQSLRSQFRLPRFLSRRPMSQALHSNAMAQRC